MIPWFVVKIVAALARPFGREVHVHGRYQDRGVRRISFHRRRPDQPWLRHLRHLRPLSDVDHYQM